MNCARAENASGRAMRVIAIIFFMFVILSFLMVVGFAR